MTAAATILLVEDDPGLGFVIQDTLRERGYTVHLCRDGREGLKQFSERDYNLCLLDVMMPKKDGYELARDIRKVNDNVPIIFITAKGMTADKVEGFKSGADDYITKPFTNEEFLLRIEAVLRRTKANSRESTQHIFEIGDYRFDAENFLLEYKDQGRTLTKKEAGILKLLCERKNKVTERELITTAVWGDSSYFTGRSLDVFITKLRKYLGEDARVSIANVHGVGFKLEC